jgi:hypothetical protein
MMTRGKLRDLIAIGTMALVWASGCGGRTPTGAENTNQNDQSNNNANTNNNSNTNTNQNTNTGGECDSAQECLVARKWDECCSCPVVASQADLDADECLLPLEQSHVPEQCIVDCPAVPCPACSSDGWSPTCRQGECEWKEGRCTQNAECVVALPVDDCCLAAFPATSADIEADPCLVYWGPWAWDVPEQCLEQWDPQCDYIDCAPMGPASRAVECAEVGCSYVDECESEDDCALLVNGRQCCPCPEAWPVSMVDHDPCLVFPGEQIPPDCRPPSCEGVACEQCPSDQIAACEGSCVTLWPAYQGNARPPGRH